MKIADRTKQYIEDMGGTEEAAKIFKVPTKRLQAWINLGRFPDAIYDIVLEDHNPKTPEPPVRYDEPEVEEFRPEPQQVEEPSPVRDGGDIGAADARMMDLHYRVLDLEQQVIPGLAMRIEALQAQAINGPSKVPQPASMARPGGGYDGGIRAATNGGGGDYALQPGRAPTREQAHWSAQGQRGKLAGPATQRVRTPGSPGNYDWNKPRPVKR